MGDHWRLGQEPVWRAGKKLEAAAEYWISGGKKKKGDRKQLEEDARVLGVILADPGPEEVDEFKVWPENWEVLVWWGRVCTQWRVGMSGPIGGDYGAWFELFRLYGVKDQQSLFEDLQLMEGAVLNKLAEGQG